MVVLGEGGSRDTLISERYEGLVMLLAVGSGIMLGIMSMEFWVNCYSLSIYLRIWSDYLSYTSLFPLRWFFLIFSDSPNE